MLVTIVLALAQSNVWMQVTVVMDIIQRFYGLLKSLG